ncbi:MAG: hypothetical protein VKM34_02535 [Cyanobacteriota bacterium]|nr:hypothetical protein [Cyanobacteriota bacterium]
MSTGGQGADDNYTANGQSSDTGADGQVPADTVAGDLPVQTPQAAAPAVELIPDENRSSAPLRAERRKSNQLGKGIRTLWQQLNRFSEINPEECARLQEAERQMEEASAQKVAAVAAERDEAKQQILQLRKDRLLERAFSQAEGRSGPSCSGTPGSAAALQPRHDAGGAGASPAVAQPPGALAHHH